VSLKHPLENSASGMWDWIKWKSEKWFVKCVVLCLETPKLRCGLTILTKVVFFRILLSFSRIVRSQSIRNDADLELYRHDHPAFTINHPFHFLKTPVSSSSMFSRLSRFLTRSKHRKKHRPFDQPVPRPPSLAPTRHFSTSSGHSSSCTIEPDRAPSFLEIVCNDSQPVYCMETVPLFHPASLPPGTRKANSLYESAHDEILRERIRCVATEEEERRERRGKRKRISGLSKGFMRNGREEVTRRNGREQGARRSSEEFPRRTGQEEYLRRNVQEEFVPRGQVQQGNMPRIRRQPVDYGRADGYGSMDCYYGPPIYHDPSRYKDPTPEPSRYRESSRQYQQNRQHRPPVPTHPGPFRTPHPNDPYNHHHHHSIPVDPYSTRPTSIRQGPYSHFPQSASSPYHHPDLHRSTYSTPFDAPEIPQTRVTRLKQPARTFWRDDGVASEIGIGLGRISGMAASRSVASRNVRSEIALTSTSTSWSTPSERRFADQVSLLLG
jgi:hypothetical protein